MRPDDSSGARRNESPAALPPSQPPPAVGGGPAGPGAAVHPAPGVFRGYDAPVGNGGGYRPSSRIISFEYLDKIREELHQLDIRLELLSREKQEIHAHYVKYYEQAYKLNAELHRQADINGRYQAIITQLLPMLAPSVQDGVRHDMDSIKQLSSASLPPAPPAPVIALTDVPQGTSPGGRMPPFAGPPSYMGEGDRKPRGRPPKQTSTVQRADLPAKRMREDDPTTQYDTAVAPVPPIHPGGFARTHPPSILPPPNAGSADLVRAPTQPPAAPASSVSPIVHQSPPMVPKSSKLVSTLEHGDVVCALALTNPFAYVFTGGKGTLKIWDVTNVREQNKAPLVSTIPCMDSYIRATKITPDGKTLIVAGEVRYMSICDVGSSNPAVLGRIDTNNEFTYALATSNDSRVVFSCSSEGSVDMWDIHNRRHIRQLGMHGKSATCCSLTPDGSRLITGSLDRTVKVWDIASGKEVDQILFPSSIYSLGYCPIQPPTIAVGLETAAVHIKNLVDSNGHYEMRGVHTNCVLSLKYANSGNWFVTSGKDKKWVCWKTPITRLFDVNESSSTLCCEISACDNFVVTGSGDNVANVYSMMF